MKASPGKSAFSKEVLAFIAKHENDDPYLLALKPSPFSDISIKKIVQQVQGRKVAKRKFPFLLNFDQYQYPVKESLEQASSEFLARYKSQIIGGNKMVDLTGGMGIDTYILGQEFEEVSYVEPNSELYEITGENFETLGFSKCKRYNTTCEAFLSTNTEQFDWAYIDPSRRISGTRKISISNYAPNIVELKEDLTSVAKNVMVKLSPMQDITECIDVLNNVVQVWVISLQKEVKELLLHLSRDNIVSGPKISVVDLNKNGETTFSYSFEDRTCLPEFSDLKRFLFLPGAALVKSELHNRYAAENKLSKLHPNTQLFTSDHEVKNYLGRTFEVIKSIRLNPKEIRQILPDMKVNVITKNFPLKPQEIAKKYKLKDGGDYYLIAFTSLGDKREYVVCKKKLQKYEK